MAGGGGKSGAEQQALKVLQITNPALYAHFQLQRNLAQTLSHSPFLPKGHASTDFFATWSKMFLQPSSWH